MKSIKSFLLLAISTCIITSLQAQDAKSPVAKQMEMPLSNIPSPPSEFKPQPQATPVTTVTPAKATEPVAKREEKLPVVKTELRTFNEADIIIPGGAEGKKILSGNKTNPAETGTMPSTAMPPVAPPVIKPPVSKQQQ